MSTRNWKINDIPLDTPGEFSSAFTLMYNAAIQLRAAGIESDEAVLLALRMFDKLVLALETHDEISNDLL
jgi:hypothetical protein